MITLTSLTNGVRRIVGAAYVIGVGVVDKAEETIGIHPGRKGDTSSTAHPGSHSAK